MIDNHIGATTNLKNIAHDEHLLFFATSDGNQTIVIGNSKNLMKFGFSRIEKTKEMRKWTESNKEKKKIR